MGLPSAVGSFPIKDRAQEIKLSEQRGARNCQDFFDPRIFHALSYFGMHARINARLNTPLLLKAKIMSNFGTVGNLITTN